MKNIRLFFICVLAVLFIVHMPVYAAEYYGDFQYEESEEFVAIYSYNGADSEVSIPAYIKEKPVTIIKDYAFLLCNSVKKIIVPSTVKTIEANAFSGASYLKKVVLASEDTKIEENEETEEQGKQEETDTEEKQEETDTQRKPEGTDAQGKQEGTDTQGKLEGTDTQGKQEGTDTQGKQEGTDAHGKQEGTNTQGKQEGTDTQGKREESTMKSGREKSVTDNENNQKNENDTRDNNTPNYEVIINPEADTADAGEVGTNGRDNGISDTNDEMTGIDEGIDNESDNNPNNINAIDKENRENENGKTEMAKNWIIACGVLVICVGIGCVIWIKRKNK